MSFLLFIAFQQWSRNMPLPEQNFSPTGITQWFKLIYRSFGQKSMHCTFYMYCGIRPKIDSSAFFFISLRFKIQEFFSSFKLQC